jgi:hypothetical protein
MALTGTPWPRGVEPIHRTFAAACLATWTAAPLVVAVSAVWAVATLPVVMALIGVLPVSWILVSLPFLVATTGVFSVAAAVADGMPVGWRVLVRIDPGLALVAWGLGIAIELLLASGDWGAIGASVIGAVSVLTIPLALAYGAVRDRRGSAALRGGIVLAIIRPDLAITLSALAVLAGFAVVVSAGALVLCVPAIIVVFACMAVARDLERLGGSGAISGPSVAERS